MGVSLLYAAAQHSYKCMTRQMSSISCQKAKCNNTGPVCRIESRVGPVGSVSMIHEPPNLMRVPPPKVCMVSHHIIVNIISANGQVVLALGVNTNGGSEDTGGRTMMGDKTHGVRPWCVASAGKLIVVLFFVPFQSLTHHPFLYCSIPSSPTASYLLCLLSPHQCRSIPASYPF